jgi:hypothetical protein
MRSGCQCRAVASQAGRNGPRPPATSATKKLTALNAAGARRAATAVLGPAVAVCGRLRSVHHLVPEVWTMIRTDFSAQWSLSLQL